MLPLHTVELFISVLTFFMAYLVVVTCSNVFRAWVAAKMGDDTGVQLGFLTWNPLFHVDPIGLFCLFAFYIGWGRMVPIYPFNIDYSHRALKLAVAYLSDTVAHFVLSVVGVIMLLAIFDVNIVAVMRYMVLTHNVSHLPIANMYPAVSSLAVSVGFIIFAFVYLNVVLGVLNFIINVSTYVLFVFSDRFDKVARYSQYITIGLPIFLLLFFSPVLRLLSINLISYIGFVIAKTCGIA